MALDHAGAVEEIGAARLSPMETTLGLAGACFVGELQWLASDHSGAGVDPSGGGKYLSNGNYS